MKKISVCFCTFTFLLCLFIFPHACITGAKTGLLLWFEIVLPTLLPFMIVSNLIIRFGYTHYISFIFYPFLHKMLGITKDGCYPFIIGILSGYPTGGKACNDLIMNKKITKEEGQFLIGFCNNASPMFVLSFVAMENLGLYDKKYLFLFISILSSILGSVFYHKVFSQKKVITTPPQETILTTQTSGFSISELLDDTILSSFEVLVKVGGYIMLFSILASIIQTLPILHSFLKIVLIGLLEVTTGIHAIQVSTLPEITKIVLAGMITTFGGFSSIVQTKSVTYPSGLSIVIYTICKCISSFIAGILFYFLFCFI